MDVAAGKARLIDGKKVAAAVIERVKEARDRLVSELQRVGARQTLEALQQVGALREQGAQPSINSCVESPMIAATTNSAPARHPYTG